MSAIEKINQEMQKRPDDLYMEIVGHYIIDRCGADEACEKKAADPSKSLTGAMSAIQAAARKKAVNGCAVLTPNQVFAETDKYFDFPADEDAQRRAMNAMSGGSAPEKPTSPAAVSLSLEDFL